jgi:hypothetical protein
MKRTSPSNGWAIYGQCGFYIGWQFTRKEAIAEHVNTKHGYSEWPLSSTGLTAEQKWAWKACQAQGDRAVKITIAKRHR